MKGNDTVLNLCLILKVTICSFQFSIFERNYQISLFLSWSEFSFCYFQQYNARAMTPKPESKALLWLEMHPRFDGPCTLHPEATEIALYVLLTLFASYVLFSAFPLLMSCQGARDRQEAKKASAQMAYELEREEGAEVELKSFRPKSSARFFVRWWLWRVFWKKHTSTHPRTARRNLLQPPSPWRGWLKWMLAPVLPTKAMRLPEIFGLSTFLVFRTFWTFGLRNKSGILTLVSNVRKFSRNSSSKPLSKNYGKNLLFLLFTGHLRSKMSGTCQNTYIPKTHSKPS